ncbi:MAG: P-loop NTPase [Actinomycetia bacterium]|nr:P-loop NTPase [Actinomycetes bacterium]
MMLDTLALVSSDPLCSFDLSRTAQDTLARVVQTFATGEECLKALSYHEQGDACVVLVDSALSDLSPLNLVDALRREHPQIACILLADDPSSDLVSRAMLAGARATLPPAATGSELSDLLRRLAPVAQAEGNGAHRGTPEDKIHQGPIVVVSSARGGCGKSTVSALFALVAGQADLDVALVDFDLQFGDLGFLFDVAPEHTLADLAETLSSPGKSCRGFSVAVAEGVSLYAPSPVPEQAEVIAGRSRMLLTALSGEHELVVVNTGAFHALSQLELLDRADRALCLLDQTLVGARATLRMRDLCTRSGIPSARFSYVVERAHRSNGYHPSLDEIAGLLGQSALRFLDDGGLRTAQALDRGGFDEVLGGGRSALAAQVALLLEDIALSTGLSLNSLPHMRSTLRRESKGRFLR